MNKRKVLFYFTFNVETVEHKKKNAVTEFYQLAIDLQTSSAAEGMLRAYILCLHFERECTIGIKRSAQQKTCVEISFFRCTS